MISSLTLKCVYCEVILTFKYGLSTLKTLDHFIPRSGGGRDTEENLELCCHECNQDKANLFPEEWLKILEQRFNSLVAFEYPNIIDVVKVTTMISNLKQLITNYKKGKNFDKKYKTKTFYVRTYSNYRRCR